MSDAEGGGDGAVDLAEVKRKLRAAQRAERLRRLAEGEGRPRTLAEMTIWHEGVSRRYGLPAVAAAVRTPPAEETPQDTRTAAAGVVVPSALARPLLRVLVRALAREVREDGGTVPPGIERLLADLARAADHQPSIGSGVGTTYDPPATVEIGTADAASLMGCSKEYARRLAREGRLPARRVGRTWLITVDKELRNEHHADQRETTRHRRGGAAPLPGGRPVETGP